MKEGDTIALYDHMSGNDYEYDDFCDEIACTTGIRGNSFFVDAQNINWQGRNGYALAKDRAELAKTLCSFHNRRCNVVVNKGEGNTLDAIAYHHDCPTGTVMTVMTLHKAKKDGIYQEAIEMYGKKE